MKATQVITAEQRSRVASTVAAAESRTSCEIVPVVATSSGRYDRAEDLVGLWSAILGAVVCFVTLPGHADAPGQWNTQPIAIQALLLALVTLVCFVLGAVLASRLHGLRRLFSPRQQMVDEVNLRARELFFDRRVHHTSGASGILIFVSLYERMAVVLGDQSVVDKLGPQFCADLCRQLTTSLRTADICAAICETIEQAATSLETVLPATEPHRNELPDALVLID